MNLLLITFLVILVTVFYIIKWSYSPLNNPKYTETQHAAESAFVKEVQFIACMHMINQLREDEGSYVVIFCDNPDPSSTIGCAVVISSEYTNWTDTRFEGENLHDALTMAVNAFLKTKNITSSVMVGGGNKDGTL